MNSSSTKRGYQTTNQYLEFTDKDKNFFIHIYFLF